MLTLKIENNSYLASVKNVNVENRKQFLSCLCKEYFKKKNFQSYDLVGSAKMCNAGLEILVWNSIHAKEQWNYIFRFI